MFLKNAVRVLLAVSLSAASIVGLSSANVASAIEDVSCAAVDDRSTVWFAANAVGGLCLRGAGLRTVLFPYEIYVYCAGPYNGQIFFRRPSGEDEFGLDLAPIDFTPGTCQYPPRGVEITGVRIF